MRVAFYAPLKPPDHPVPSGDRRMACLLMRAIGAGGHDVFLASRLRAFVLEESETAQQAVRDAATAEAADLIGHWTMAPEDAPDLWFTYHLYYRAPDWIGPAVCEALRIPYVIAEASFAMKRAGGVWAIGHEGAERALARADIVFSMAARDTPGLYKAEGFSADVVDLPPFTDCGARAGAARRIADDRPAGRPPVLLAVGMMRARAKLASYRMLSEALVRIADTPWRLQIAGDGPERAAVERLFADFDPGRVTFLGTLDEADLSDLYGAADLLVWPGVDEAYGMVYLEAQASGTPVVAMDHGGVGDVVHDGVSGRLVAAGDIEAYAHAIAALLADPDERDRLGRTARDFVSAARSLDSAASIINTGLAAARKAA